MDYGQKQWFAYETCEEVFNALRADGSEYKLFEDYRTDNGTTNAPHLTGTEGKGQKYRYFKNGPQRLREVFEKFCTQYKDTTSWFMVALTLLMAWSDIALENHGN